MEARSPIDKGNSRICKSKDPPNQTKGSVEQSNQIESTKEMRVGSHTQFIFVETLFYGVHLITNFRIIYY